MFHSLGILLPAVFLLCGMAAADVMQYAEWAHHHLVWKSNGHNQSDVTNMLRTYRALNISVGALNIDSGWSTGYNNFMFDLNLFPDPKGLFDEIHSNGQRVVLWVTSFIDTDSSNYDEAVANNYVFNLTMNWWHGNGRLLNFSDDAAVTWFGNQIQENLWDLYGCTDGWKVDGVDPYVLGLLNPEWPWKRYADYYYDFFLNFTRSRCGNTSLIMARPCDCFPPGGIGDTGICPIHLPFAPRNSVFMGWVGDQDSTFNGMSVAYGNMMASAEYSYISFGSDTGGYRGNGPSPHGVPKDVYLRWATMNAMMPVMETGGDNRHCPWEFDDDTVQRYRDLVNFHHALVPYLYVNGMALAQQVSGSLVTPVSTGGHLLGPSCFGFPILGANVTEALFSLPNSTVGWYAYGSTTHYSGGEAVRFNATELDALAFFVRADAMLLTYDTKLGGLFPAPDYPLQLQLYLDPSGELQRTISTSSASYLGIAVIEVTVNVPERQATVRIQRDSSSRRLVSVRVLHPEFDLTVSGN